MSKYYTGVGSRKTPKEICDLMTKIASELEKQGYILRSGGAAGSDFAYQKGVHKLENKQIFIPWKNFGYGISLEDLIPEKVQDAMELVSIIHPNPKALTDAGWKLHARNVFEVLGSTLKEPSKFLICYAKIDKDGNPLHGTRTAWMVAKLHEIPCFNLFIKADYDRVIKMLDPKK